MKTSGLAVVQNAALTIYIIIQTRSNDITKLNGRITLITMNNKTRKQIN